MEFCGDRRCVRCGNETDGGPCKDHILPIYQGGSDAIENLQPMCRSCNSAKTSEAVDYRPDGWRNALVARGVLSDEMPSETPNGIGDEMPLECLHPPSSNHQERKKDKGTTAVRPGEPANANTPDFETCWTQYPKRAGGNPKRRALKAWNARLANGRSVDEMTKGIQRYRAFCDSTEKTGTEFVMQAATFFGRDEQFLELWEIPDSSRPKSAGELVREANAHLLRGKTYDAD